MYHTSHVCMLVHFIHKHILVVDTKQVQTTLFLSSIIFTDTRFDPNVSRPVREHMWSGNLEKGNL